MDIEWLHKLEVVVMLSVSTPPIKGFLILKNNLNENKNICFGQKRVLTSKSDKELHCCMNNYRHSSSKVVIKKET